MTTGSHTSTNARITVIIPCCCDESFVPIAMASIQEDEPVEIVVVDDASNNPRTEAALARLEAQGTKVVRRRDNGGIGPARNSGLAATSAPFVFPLDADDLAEPGMLGRMADILEQRPDAVVCFGDYAEFGDSRIVRAVPAELDPYRVIYTNEYPVSALFRRSVLEDVGGWWGQTYEDWDMWMTLDLTPAN